jgi:hypothetical protein
VKKGIFDVGDAAQLATSIVVDKPWVRDALIERHRDVFVADVASLNIAEVTLLTALLHSHPSVVATACIDKVRCAVSSCYAAAPHAHISVVCPCGGQYTMRNQCSPESAVSLYGRLMGLSLTPTHSRSDDDVPATAVHGGRIVHASPRVVAARPSARRRAVPALSAPPVPTSHTSHTSPTPTPLPSSTPGDVDSQGDARGTSLARLAGAVGSHAYQRTHDGSVHYMAFATPLLEADGVAAAAFVRDQSDVLPVLVCRCGRACIQQSVSVSVRPMCVRRVMAAARCASVQSLAHDSPTPVTVGVFARHSKSARAMSALLRRRAQQRGSDVAVVCHETPLIGELDEVRAGMAMLHVVVRCGCTIAAPLVRASLQLRTLSLCRTAHPSRTCTTCTSS